jgi:hypothetical protein
MRDDVVREARKNPAPRQVSAANRRRSLEKTELDRAGILVVKCILHLRQSVRPEYEAIARLAAGQRETPRNVPAQRSSKCRIDRARNRIDHLLVKTWIGWRRIEAVVHDDQRIVQVHALVVLGTIEVVDLEDGADRPRFEFLVWNLQGRNRTLQPGDARIEGENLQRPVHGIAGTAFVRPRLVDVYETRGYREFIVTASRPRVH